MKKIILSVTIMALCTVAIGQSELRKAIHHYYRYDPFERSFSSFIGNLMSDPALLNTTVIKKTDSTLFFFKGDYRGHNPFGFKATHTEVRFAEIEIQGNDSLAAKDTIMAYQILGYADRGNNGMAAVKSEYEKFDRKFGPDFSDKSVHDLVENSTVQGTTCNYFLANLNLSPMTVIWGKLNDKECIFVVTVRLIKKENQAMLPFSFE